jgi:hypothetical protein
MKQERTHRIVIRNKHYSTPTAQITVELEKQGYKVRNILNVKHHITKKHTLFFIDLEPTMEFLCNMKIAVEAPRQKKNTSFHAQDVNIMDIPKHTVQTHIHALNAEEIITQSHVQNHQIHRPNMHCAEEIILQVTKDAKCTRTSKKKQSQANQPNYS